MAEIIDTTSRMQKSRKYGQRFVVEITTERFKWEFVYRLYTDKPPHMTATALYWGQVIKRTSGRLSNQKDTKELVEHAKDAVERLEDKIPEKNRKRQVKQ
ncbi:hypothetical protein [Candidatus Nanohalovita haloferacivicina]|jgi:hypothetical protein|uniref:hypothetical protein n=1 Tax=Candidatus Nanohalovita haloferacivicina TaxID=2978046 RepID=UPI00325FA584|nr:hypothetical protein HBNXNv_0261 [Candidatus Nanohalobia archaeon BNXNv]